MPAPQLFVVMTWEPAFRYSLWMSSTSRGSERHTSSKERLRNTPAS